MTGGFGNTVTSPTWSNGRCFRWLGEPSDLQPCLDYVRHSKYLDIPNEYRAVLWIQTATPKPTKGYDHASWKKNSCWAQHGWFATIWWIYGGKPKKHSKSCGGTSRDCGGTSRECGGNPRNQFLVFDWWYLFIVFHMFVVNLAAFGSTSSKMQADSRCFSSATLVRGSELVRNMSMSLEGDPKYADMLEEKKKLEATRQEWIEVFFCDLFPVHLKH